MTHNKSHFLTEMCFRSDVYLKWKNKTSKENIMKKQCAICKEEFEAANEFQSICSDECKEEALKKLDSNSDECLSCQ